MSMGYQERVALSAELLNMSTADLARLLDAETSDDTSETVRFWSMPADPEAGHPEPWGTDTWGIVDEQASGVVAWVHRDTASAMVARLNR